MKVDNDAQGFINWAEKRRLERYAQRLRIQKALKAGCLEFEHKSRPWVAIITPAQSSTEEVPVMRLTRFDEQGPWGHVEITGGQCETERGRELIATRLQSEGFVNARLGALGEVFCCES